MSAATIFGLCGALLAALGLYGAIVQPHPLRRIVAMNVVGGGIFLVYGVVARRGAFDAVDVQRARQGRGAFGGHGVALAGGQSADGACTTS